MLVAVCQYTDRICSHMHSLRAQQTLRKTPIEFPSSTAKMSAVAVFMTS